MAKLEKKELDTRSFVEICAALTQHEWATLRTKLLISLQKTDQTLNNWRSGRTYPNGLAERREVANVVSRVLGIRTNHQNLFKVD